jgi:hypothetical protein
LDAADANTGQQRLAQRAPVIGKERHAHWNLEAAARPAQRHAIA